MGLFRLLSNVNLLLCAHVLLDNLKLNAKMKNWIDSNTLEGVATYNCDLV